MRRTEDSSVESSVEDPKPHILHKGSIFSGQGYVCSRDYNMDYVHLNSDNIVEQSWGKYIRCIDCWDTYDVICTFD